MRILLMASRCFGELSTRVSLDDHLRPLMGAQLNPQDEPIEINGVSYSSAYVEVTLGRYEPDKWSPSGSTMLRRTGSGAPGTASALRIIRANLFDSAVRTYRNFPHMFEQAWLEEHESRKREFRTAAVDLADRSEQARLVADLWESASSQDVEKIDFDSSDSPNGFRVRFTRTCCTNPSQMTYGTPLQQLFLGGEFVGWLVRADGSHGRHGIVAVPHSLGELEKR